MHLDIKNKITPDYVLNMHQPAKEYLCPLQANVYGVQFLQFRIRNYETDQSLIQIIKRPQDFGKPLTEASRTVRYNFGPYFFTLKMIGTSLKFRVGPKPIKKFRLIERHYFKDKLIKSYQFPAVFCMPNSINNMQAIYELPELNQGLIEEMIENPYLTVSDSFFFSDDQLILHTRAEFNYAGSGAQEQQDNEEQEDQLQ